MRYLLDNKYFPLTNCIGLMPLSAQEYSQHHFNELLESHQKGSMLHGSIHYGRPVKRYEKVVAPLHELLDLMVPVIFNGGTKDLFIALTNGWSAHLENGISSHVSLRSRSNSLKLGIEGVSIRCEEDTFRKTKDGYKGFYGITELAVYATHKTHGPFNFKRSIMLLHDGDKWDFVTHGDPYPFEDLEKYTLKRKKDRFTPDMLKTYLAHLNLFPFDDDFYLPEAYIIETEPHSRLKTKTLEEIQSQL